MRRKTCANFLVEIKESFGRRKTTTRKWEYNKLTWHISIYAMKYCWNLLTHGFVFRQILVYMHYYCLHFDSFRFFRRNWLQHIDIFIASFSDSEILQIKPKEIACTAGVCIYVWPFHFTKINSHLAFCSFRWLTANMFTFSYNLFPRVEATSNEFIAR